MKCKIAKHLGIRPTIIAQHRMKNRTIKKSKLPLSSKRLKLFDDPVLAIKFKESLIVDLDRPFHKIKRKDFSD
jgi:hypothetical protein